MLAITSVALTSTLVAPSGAVAVDSSPPQLCRGELPTLVGDGSRWTLRGTPGDDVVVTYGAVVVDTGAGDDTVCVRGPARDVVRVDTGDGDDRVDVYAARHGVFVTSGAGDDVVRPSLKRAARIDVRGGEGDDRLELRGKVRGGRIDLGAGLDSLDLRTVAVRGAVLRGGPGRDTFRWHYFLPASRRVTIDQRHRVLARDGQRLAALTGFDLFDLGALDRGTGTDGLTRDGLLTFHGGPESEDVSLGFTARARVDLGPGDDEVVTWAGAEIVGPLRGGDGADTVTAFAFPGSGRSATGGDAALVDLAAGRVRIVRPGADTVVRLERFNGARLRARRVEVVGSDTADAVHAFGCHLDVATGAGDDVIQMTFAGVDVEEYCGSTPLSLTAAGGPGDDVMRGNELDNTLVGGDGDDTADGGGGIDSCDAETRIACEDLLPRW